MQHITRRGFTKTALACLFFAHFVPGNATTTIDDLSIGQPVLPSLLSVDFGVDSDKGQDVTLLGDFTVSNRHRISAGLSDNRSTVSTSDEDLETNSFSIGYTYISIDETHNNFQYEKWGDSEKLETETFRANIVFDVKDNTLISLEPLVRKITVFGADPAGNSGNIKDSIADMTSIGFGLGYSYFPVGKWSYGVSYKFYHYSDDPQSLATNDDLLALGRLQIVADKNQFSTSLNYYKGTEVYGFSWMRSESSIDSDLWFVTSLSITSDVLDFWTMGITGGWQNNIDDTVTGFISGSITYYW